MPAVVSIVISKNLEELKKELGKIADIIPGFSISDIPPEKIDAHNNVQIGGGSGFIADPTGIILTNRHVISESTANYTIMLSSGRKFEAEVLARDPLDDIAILKISPGKTKLPALDLGDSENLKLGQTVLAFGNVLGLFQNTVSKGIVSGLSRSITARINPNAPPYEMRGLIQTDAAINPGNSGGPLTDIEGKVVGINVAVVAGAQNVGFAIPTKIAERDLEDLKKYGIIRRPFLGVRYITLDEDSAQKLNQPIDYGALVLRDHSFGKAVVPGSPAEKAGIKEQDIILTWNGKKITPQRNIQDCLSESEVGEVVKLEILRGNKKLQKEVKLSERK